MKSKPKRNVPPGSRPRKIECPPAGTEFGDLKVLREGEAENGHRTVVCECKCGEVVSKLLGNLLKGHNKRCGLKCKARKRKPKPEKRPRKRTLECPIAQEFGWLTALCEGELQSGNRTVVCMCKCGEFKVVQLHNLLRGATKSCGCQEFKFGKGALTPEQEKRRTDRISRTMGTVKTLEEFAAKADEIHGGKYDYSKFEFTRMGVKSEIVCPIHGGFQMHPTAHIVLNHGCPGCNHDAKLLTKDQWTAKIEAIHGDSLRVDFPKTRFTQKTLVDVTCGFGHEFRTTLNRLCRGHGCLPCRDLKLQMLGQKGEQTELYSIRLDFPTGETCYKIGVATIATNRARILRKQTGAKITFLRVVSGRTRDILNRENELKHKNAALRASTPFEFTGHTECFLRPIDIG